MKNNTQGFTTGKFLALFLAAALLLTAGATAAASADDPDIVLEELDVIEIIDDEETPMAAPAEEASADSEDSADPEETLELVNIEKLEDEIVVERPGQTYLFGPINDDIIEAAAAEIAALPEELKEEIVEIWNNNHLVYSDPAEMLSVYAIDGVSEQAAFVLILANIDAHVAYINNGFNGEDRSYLEQYDLSYDRICEALNELGVTDLSADGVRDLLLAEIAEAYAGMRWAEENEEAGTGERTMFNVANTYWDIQSNIDVYAFFGLCEEIAG